MVIVHIAPCCVYNEGYGYQENLLPKHHAMLGHVVYLIVPFFEFQNGVKRLNLSLASDYINPFGVHVIRRAYKKYFSSKLTAFFSYIPVIDLLEDIRPDLIFFHSVVSKTLSDVFAYKKKNDKVHLLVDNHLDIYNAGFRNCFTRFVRTRYFSSLCKKNASFVDRFYGVTPGRQDFLTQAFGIPPSKTDLLIMGADDKFVEEFKTKESRIAAREKYGITPHDFLVVTGGKIDKEKRIPELINACKDLKRVKLLVFGTISDEVLAEIGSLRNEGDRVIFTGWLNEKAVYECFAAADLIVFLGLHSVLWEQACAMRVPVCFRKLEGFTHVLDLPFAVEVTDLDEDHLREQIKKLAFTEDYQRLASKASSFQTNIFLYSEIAKKTLLDSCGRNCEKTHP